MCVGAYAFRREIEDVHQCYAAIIAVEKSVRRSVQAAVDDIRRLSGVWRRVLHVEGNYF